MKRHILYIGGFNFNKENASSIRVLHNAEFFDKIGYEVTILGKIKENIAKGKSKSIFVKNIEEFKGRKIDFAFNIDTVKAEVKTINKIATPIIIAYNYPPIAFYKLLKYCRKYKIRLVPDITEWHEIDGNRTVMKIIRSRLNNWKMKYLNIKCSHIILATSYLKKEYSKSETLQLPFVTIHEPDFLIRDKISSKLSFVFAGTTGENFSKDRLDIIIKAFSILKGYKEEFTFHIIGPSKEDLLQTPIAKEILYLDSHLIFHGRLKNTLTREIIKASDFVVFARDIKRITKVGYPTKVFEAFSLGVPVITNNTSDLEQQIFNGKNGFLLKTNEIAEFVKIFNKVLEMPLDEIEMIKMECIKSNPFYFMNYKEATLKFLMNI